jgi:hypothetical protein
MFLQNFGQSALFATIDLSLSCSPAPCAKRPLRQASRTERTADQNLRFCPCFRLKTAFQRYQPVHRANFIGLQSVDLARGARAKAAAVAGERARPSAARGSGRVSAQFRLRDGEGLAEVALEDRETVEVLGEGDIGDRAIAKWVHGRGAAFLEPAPHHAFSRNRRTAPGGQITRACMSSPPFHSPASPPGHSLRNPKQPNSADRGAPLLMKMVMPDLAPCETRITPATCHAIFMADSFSPPNEWAVGAPAPSCGGWTGWGVAPTAERDLCRGCSHSDRLARPPSFVVPHKSLRPGAQARSGWGGERARGELA